jgi:predicted RNase H-like HicB family nuclease
MEITPAGFSAYSPGLDGCAYTGATKEEVAQNMRGAIAFHADGLPRDGQTVPERHAYSAYVELPA